MKPYLFCTLRSESERLGKVWSFTNGGIIKPELLVVPSKLVEAIPVGARIRIFNLSGHPE